MLQLANGAVCTRTLDGWWCAAVTADQFNGSVNLSSNKQEGAATRPSFITGNHFPAFWTASGSALYKQGCEEGEDGMGCHVTSPAVRGPALQLCFSPFS